MKYRSILVPLIAAGFLASSSSPAAAWSNTPATPQPDKEKKDQPEKNKDKEKDKEKDNNKDKSKEKHNAAGGEAYALDFKMKRIDGTDQDLSAYKGKVVVIVNVASKCGYTGQYAALEELYREHKDHGLVILGFPANNFGGQEPKSNSEIAEFCKSTYDVTFPMFEKISVKGDDQHALYKKLTSQPPPIGGDPKWNFTKFVLNKEGNVVARFDAKGKEKQRDALEPDFVKKVEDLLGVKKETEKPKKEEKKPSGS